MGFKLPGKSMTSGTSGHSSALKMKEQADSASALKDLGHGGHPGMTEKEASAADHGGKRSLEERKEAGTEIQYKKAAKKKKPYVKKGGKATGKMKDYPIGSKERYAEYEARGWAHDKTTKGGEPTATTTTTPKSDTRSDRKVKKDIKKGDRAVERVDKPIIKAQKMLEKAEAKQPESDKGSKVSGKERAMIKSRKLARKVEADEGAGKTGLGSKIRAKRAARKAKKVKEKYGEETIT